MQQETIKVSTQAHSIQLRLRKLFCTQTTQERAVKRGEILIYCTWHGMTGFYTCNGHLKFIRFITSFSVSNSGRHGMLVQSFVQAIFCIVSMCWEGYRLLCSRALSMHPRANIQSRCIKVWSDRSISPVVIDQGSEASGTSSWPSEAINHPVSRVHSISGKSHGSASRQLWSRDISVMLGYRRARIRDNKSPGSSLCP